MKTFLLPKIIFSSPSSILSWLDSIMMEGLQDWDLSFVFLGDRKKRED